MTVSDKLLNKLLGELNLHSQDAPVIAKHLEKRLRQIEDICFSVENYHRRVRKAGEDYQKTLYELGKELKEIQGKCEHLDITFYPDAAGGSDSHSSCNICGAEV